MNRRVIIGLVSGALLGIVCIFGVYFRMGDRVSGLFLFATWYNRIIMGLMIGFYPVSSNNYVTTLFRGAVLGLLVSFALYSASNFIDTPGFIAGIVYGIIIDFVCTKYSLNHKIPC